MQVWELAAQWGTDQLRCVERPTPTPGPGEVLLRCQAWSVNYRDHLMVTGQYNPRLRLPCVPLSDAVGEVVSIGEGVDESLVGKQVIALFMTGWQEGPITEAHAKTSLGGGGIGMAAEYVVLPATGVIPVPAGLSAVEAATLPCAALTAWNALRESSTLQADETVLIQGTGGVSLFALQFATAMGARAIVISSSDEKLARVMALGAFAGVNYRTHPDWETEVKRLNNGHGCDHVVEVGGGGTLARSFQAVKMGGTISLIGVLSGNQATVNPVPILMKSLRVVGIFAGSGAMFRRMNHFIEQQQIKPVVDRVYPFSELPKALAQLPRGEHFGKICLS